MFSLETAAFLGADRLKHVRPSRVLHPVSWQRELNVRVISLAESGYVRHCPRPLEGNAKWHYFPAFSSLTRSNPPVSR